MVRPSLSFPVRRGRGATAFCLGLCQSGSDARINLLSGRLSAIILCSVTTASQLLFPFAQVERASLPYNRKSRRCQGLFVDQKRYLRYFIRLRQLPLFRLT